MPRLLVVSNRLPVRAYQDGDTFGFTPSTGGLATGLGSVAKSRDLIWMGWPGVLSEQLSEQQKELLRNRLAEKNLLPVFLAKRQFDAYYGGFCNRTIWPLFHYFALHARYTEHSWQAYVAANREFCKEVLSYARSDDQIWVHDYQLMLLPRMIRRELPDAHIGFFLHIPWPSFELFRLLPWREEILHGLLGADLIGFHTYDYLRHFLSSACRIAGLEHSMGSLSVDNRMVKVDAFPMGIDYERFAQAARSPEVEAEVQQIRKEVGDRRIIISIDRLDYTKGIIQRLEAFDLFLLHNPQYKGKVTLVLLAVPSRTGMERYQILRKRLEALVGRINGEHGTIGWVPVWYLYRQIPFQKLVALYRLADVALVTPIRDGMNLISKEFLATKADRKGVLVLSETAGAASELGETITVNPNDKLSLVRAIKAALEMAPEEQIQRNRVMQSRLSRYTVARWADDFLSALEGVRRTQEELAVRQLDGQSRGEMIRAYQAAANRLLLLDYDGTLIEFHRRPEDAQPDKELMRILEQLAADAKNHVVVLSGRDRHTLEGWLGPLRITLAAEHGAWIRQASGDWNVEAAIRPEWKDEIRPILEVFTDRTPGSFLEEKDFSLVWHFRKSDTELARLRSQELRAAVADLAAKLDVGVFEGQKIIEIKNSVVNKGTQAERWRKSKDWQFILAIGDDYTDEDMFAALPPDAFTILVGQKPSKARFNTEDVGHVRSLLRTLAETHHA